MSSLKINLSNLKWINSTFGQLRIRSAKNSKSSIFGPWKIRWVALQFRAKSQLTVFQCLPHKRRTKQLKPNYLVLWVTVGQTRLHFRPFVVVESFFSLSGFFAELACFVIRVESMLNRSERSLIGSRAAKLIINGSGWSFLLANEWFFIFLLRNLSRLRESCHWKMTNSGSMKPKAANGLLTFWVVLACH